MWRRYWSFNSKLEIYVLFFRSGFFLVYKIWNFIHFTVAMQQRCLVSRLFYCPYSPYSPYKNLKPQASERYFRSCIPVDTPKKLRKTRPPSTTRQEVADKLKLFLVKVNYILWLSSQVIIFCSKDLPNFCGSTKKCYFRVLPLKNHKTVFCL